MPKIDRREFLKTGVKGAAIISIPVLTSSCERSNRYSTLSRKPVEGDNPTLFNLVLVTDSHVRLETDDPQNLFPSDKFANNKNRYVVEQINKVNPDLVIHLGDIPHTIPSSENHDQVMRNAHEIYKNGIEKDLYVVAGNHDIGNKPNAFTSSPVMDENSHKIFEKYWGNTFSSFDHENCHFVLLNSSVLNSGLPLEIEQKSWLINDLEKNRKTDNRIFLCMHHPLYINNPNENEHYDNIGEPERSWLLSLLEKYKVEAVFAGHSHNFFYNLYKDTDLYILPSVTFVRPDFSAMFHVAPADKENGRNDVNKLGFSLFDIKKYGYRLSTIRTYGLTGERDDTVVSQPVSLSTNTGNTVTSGVGTTLRHAWAKTVYMPCDSLDEFSHKPIRNDYLLQALGELDIAKLRIPIGDLEDRETLDRIHVFKRLEYEFTVFSIGVPSRSVKDVIFKNKDIISAWEVTIPRKQIKEAIEQLREVKKGTDIFIYLSTLDTIDDQKLEEDYVFSHFPTHGFKIRENNLLKTCIGQYRADQAIHGFVFSVNAEMNIWESIQRTDELMKELNMNGVVHFNMPRKTEAIAFTDDIKISVVVCEALISSMAVDNIEVSLDTLVDHDRGYFPRHGLVDRRYNPRPAYHAFRHLFRAVSGGRENLRISEIRTNPGIRAFNLLSPEFHCSLILPDGEQNVFELEFTANIELGENILKSMDLYTGRLKEVKLKSLRNNRIVLETKQKTNKPVLLVLK
ncbi:metallophosphoesterase family protein [candidate division KSB1 bacterium]